MKTIVSILALTAAAFGFNLSARADLLDDLLRKSTNAVSGTNIISRSNILSATNILSGTNIISRSNIMSGTLTTNLTQTEMVDALKQALTKGIHRAIRQLGQSNGFLTNLNVRIPMPEKLQTTEKTLRSLGQDKLADDFVATMNHAAEQAVPAASQVFVDTLAQMTVQDAQNLLTGPDDAATQFFRRTTETNLFARFLPIVKKATEDNKVMNSYKKLTGSTGGTNDTSTSTNSGTLGAILNKGQELLGKGSVDVDTYVTQKALDGLFIMVAEQEKKIRQNPAARTTELLQKVFGAIRK
jgi:hypothetical protein